MINRLVDGNQRVEKMQAVTTKAAPVSRIQGGVEVSAFAVFDGVVWGDWPFDFAETVLLLVCFRILVLLPGGQKRTLNAAPVLVVNVES